MSRLAKIWALPFLLVLFIVGYESCIEPPSYPSEPEIEFLSVSRDTINSLTDSVFITFSFQDGDGDLGFEDFSSDDCNLCDSSCYSHPTFSIFLVDSRKGFADGDSVQCLSPYNVPFVPLKGSTDAITGEIEVKVTGITCFPFIPTDSLFFLISVKDRSGNISNTIETSVIHLTCF